MTKNKLMTAEMLNYLFALFIDRDGQNDNQALDDVLEIGVNAEIVERVVDDLKNNNADDNAGNRPDASGKGYAADHAAGNRVQFIVQTGLGRDRTDARRFEVRGDSVKDPGNQVDI